MVLNLRLPRQPIYNRFIRVRWYEDDVPRLRAPLFRLVVRLFGGRLEVVVSPIPKSDWRECP